MGMWQVAHWSSIAGPDDEWSMVSRRTDASQYGSRDELAIIDARQSDPIDTFSPDRVVSPLWQATHASAVRKAVGGSSALASIAPPQAMTDRSVRVRSATIRRTGFPATSPTTATPSRSCYG